VMDCASPALTASAREATAIKDFRSEVLMAAEGAMRALRPLAA